MAAEDETRKRKGGGREWGEGEGVGCKVNGVGEEYEITSLMSGRVAKHTELLSTAILIHFTELLVSIVTGQSDVFQHGSHEPCGHPTPSFLPPSHSSASPVRAAGNYRKQTPRHQELRARSPLLHT